MNPPRRTALGKSTLDATCSSSGQYDVRLNDCVLSCNDDQNVAANTYAMVSSCSVLAMFWEDMSHEGERVFYVDIPSTRLRPVVGLIHGHLAVHRLDNVDDVASILDAMDYLGCTYKWKRLVQRLWILLRNEPPDRAGPMLLEHAQLLLPEFGDGYLHKLRLVYPDWTRYVCLFDHIVITPRLAVTLVEGLTRFFPAGLLIRTIVDRAPESHRSEIATHMLSIRRLGSMLHPDELTWAISRFPYMPILDCVRETFSMVNRPSGFKIPASMITFAAQNMASFFFVLESVTRRVSVNFGGTAACFTFDPVDGTVSGRVNMDKLGDTAAVAPEVYVRITTFIDDDHGAHDWWHQTDVDDDGWWSVERSIAFGQWTKVDVFWLHDPRIC